MREALVLVPWVLMWAVGGWLGARAAFRLQEGEAGWIGLAVGWTVQIWCANLFSHILPAPLAFWLGSGFALLAGGALWWFRRENFFQAARQDFWRLETFVFIALVVLSFSINRGIALFDDYAHLPTVSMMAAGYLPPRFALDPSIPYSYHHFLLFFAAELVRLGGLAVWSALDWARALTVGFALLLSALWLRRMTSSRVAAVAGSAFLFLAGGARWLLLLLPPDWLESISNQVHLIGSGASSGANLAAALTSPWGIEGMGPAPFQFSFVNGVLQPGVLDMFSVVGLAKPAFLLLFLLLFNRWRDWRGLAVLAILWSAYGLATEGEVLLIGLAFVLILLGWIICHRSLRLPRSLAGWTAALAVGSLVMLVQGGALSGMALGFIQQLQGQAQASYQTVGFGWQWPPALVSVHLGVLELIRPAHLLAALVEIGPVLLILPLLIVWGWKALRWQRWFEAALIAAAFLSFVMLAVQFEGSTGVRNTARLYFFAQLALLYAFPLGWRWAGRRGVWAKYWFGGLAGIGVLAGVVILGAELTAIQKPIASTFIAPLDMQMVPKVWNRLEPGSLVFDAKPDRGVTILGRPTNSATTWYSQKPEWKSLEKDPEPQALASAGYRYLYLGRDEWEQYPLDLRQEYETGCPHLAAEVELRDRQSNALVDFRRVYDLQACQ